MGLGLEGSQAEAIAGVLLKSGPRQAEQLNELLGARGAAVSEAMRHDYGVGISAVFFALAAVMPVMHVCGWTLMARGRQTEAAADS